MASQNRVYEDFQPPHDWAHDTRSDTLILPLEGFSRSQLKVQITSSRKVRVSGERQIEGNKWRRFYLEFPAPNDSDTNEIGAKFERGTLYVRFPKLITPVTPPQPSPPPTQQAPPPPPPPPPAGKPTTREEPKAEEAIEKKPEKKDETKMEQKEKEPPKEEEEKDISEEDRHKREADYRRRASFSERLRSMQAQDYKDAIIGLVAELKKQKTAINKLVFVFVVLLLGLYLKHLIKSAFGGSKTHQEL